MTVRFGQLYSLHDPIATRPYRGKWHGPDLGLELSRGEVKSDDPIRITWAMGASEPGDVIWTTSAYPLIVHIRVLDLLASRGFTGWSSHALDVWTKSGKRLSDYAALIISGRCGRAELTRSNIVLSEYPGGWHPQFLGHFFAEESWDGYDFFMEMPDSLGHITGNRFVTQQVRDALNQAGVGNLRFTRLTETRVLCSVYTIGLRHLLPADFEGRVERAYKEAGVQRPGA
jgi:hypothetical protein